MYKVRPSANEPTNQSSEAENQHCLVAGCPAVLRRPLVRSRVEAGCCRWRWRRGRFPDLCPRRSNPRGGRGCRSTTAAGTAFRRIDRGQSSTRAGMRGGRRGVGPQAGPCAFDAAPGCGFHRPLGGIEGRGAGDLRPAGRSAGGGPGRAAALRRARPGGGRRGRLEAPSAGRFLFQEEPEPGNAWPMSGVVQLFDEEVSFRVEPTGGRRARAWSSVRSMRWCAGTMRRRLDGAGRRGPTQAPADHPTDIPIPGLPERGDPAAEPPRGDRGALPRLRRRAGAVRGLGRLRRRAGDRPQRRRTSSRSGGG